MQNETDIAWSLYWADDRLHSCVAADEDTDQQALDKLWFDFAATLAADSRVLDVATGNGAVPVALLKSNANISIDAIDQAEIDPQRYVSNHPELAAVNFVANHNVLDLDPEQPQYNAITSQFGIEYAGLQPAADVALGCLEEGGHFMFLIHHSDSEIIRSSQPKLEEMAALLAPQGLLQTLLEVLRGAAPFSALEEKGVNHLASESARTTAISGQVFNAIEQIAKLLEEDLPAARDMAVTLNLRVTAEHDRLQQMAAAAQNETQMSAWREHIEQSGYTLSKMQPVHADRDAQDYLLAWLVQGQRS